MTTNTDGVSAMSAKLGPLLDSEEDVTVTVQGEAK